MNKVAGNFKIAQFGVLHHSNVPRLALDSFRKEEFRNVNESPKSKSRYLLLRSRIRWVDIRAIQMTLRLCQIMNEVFLFLGKNTKWMILS